MAIETDQRGAVAILRWDDGENRMNLTSMAEWHAALDQLEGVEGPLALVVIGAGKFFSNGLDLDRFGVEPDEMAPTVRSVHQLLGRMLLFPAYTVAAVNGHAFAAGAMLSACFDFRVMRSDRGYWCLPEVDLGLPLTPAMLAVITAKLPREAAHEAIMTGQRYDAAEAQMAGIVTLTAPEDDVLADAVDLATDFAEKNRAVIKRHKELLY